MAIEKPSINQSLQEFISMAENKGLDIEGDPGAGWLLVKNMRTGKLFNTFQTDVMVKFSDNGNDPIILVPEALRIEVNDCICPRFIEKHSFIKGWKPLCPDMFQEIGDELFEFMACLAGFMAMPMLCGLMGCPGKEPVTENALAENCHMASLEPSTG